MYGIELILDLHKCEALPGDQVLITSYFEQLCDLIEMERAQLHFWDYSDYPEEYENEQTHCKGISAVQFITTSSVTLHTLDDRKKIFINIFSCKEFDVKKASSFSGKFFKGKVASDTVILRV